MTEKNAIILGNFDGVHTGHRALIERALEEGGRVTAFLIDGMPAPAEGWLTPGDEKISLLKEYGVSSFIFRDFEKIRNLTPKEFIESIILPEKPSLLVCGFNYSFGKQAKGGPSDLAELGRKHSVDTAVLPAVCLGGAPVSSTAVRAALSEGDVELCEKMLGRRYSVTSGIIHGQGRGKTLGFPTCNLEIPPLKAIPGNGVYITRAVIDGKSYLSMTDVGVRPTFDGKEKVIESFLLGTPGDGYGKTARVEFIKYLRPEIKFDSAAELEKQLENDKAATEEYGRENNI